MGYTLLMRPGCGLCDDFVEALAAEAPALLAATIVVDVDSRTDWRQRYGTVIPVLLDESGAVVCESFFDAGRVAAAATPVVS